MFRGWWGYWSRDWADSPHLKGPKASSDTAGSDDDVRGEGEEPGLVPPLCCSGRVGGVRGWGGGWTDIPAATSAATAEHNSL